MLGTLRQPCKCTCNCILQKNSRGPLLTAVRKYENPNTAVFERMHPIQRVGRGKYPLVKSRHYILKMVPFTGKAETTMKCILTKEMSKIGLKGTVVEVKKSLFRNILYPAGHAVYASPENIKFYDALRKGSEEEGITYDMKQLMRKMAGFHLQVFMNNEESWTLTPSHLRIAFRKMGVGVKEENIIMPVNPVTKKGGFVFKLQLLNRIACQVRGTVYPIREDGLPPENIKYPPVWNNEPVDKSKLTEYLKKEDKSTEKPLVEEQSAEDIDTNKTENSEEAISDEKENDSDTTDKPEK